MKAEARLERREENLEELLEELQEAAWEGGGVGAWSVPGCCRKLALTGCGPLHHAGLPKDLSSSA